ncbi:MAG TPA: hypothetical protein VN736_17845 [Candidatus Limnocylindrales bacterium]|nr:hypothetical protein [Candidatus Limnocylindrales bacterium]
MIRGMAWGLFAAVALHAAADEPVLAISIDHAISRPNRNGRGIERPLFLILYKWRTDAPEVKARSFSGTLSAHCVRLPANGNQWTADIAYEAQQEKEQKFQGHIRLNLTIDDGSVRGTYDGAFHDTVLHGRVGAGLAFEQDFESPARGLLLWMPHLQRKIRGVLVVPNGGEGEKREAPLVEATQAFAAAHNLAVIGTAGLGSVDRGDGDRIVNGVRHFAMSTGHTELETAPLFFMGHSGGGRISAEFNRWLPARVGGYVSSHGSPSFRLSATALENPGVYVTSEGDPKVSPAEIEVGFVLLRSEGARVALAVEEGAQHPMGPGAMPFYLYALEKLVQQRLSAGSTALHPVDETAAWVADNATWDSGITRIMPLRDAAALMRSPGPLLDRPPAIGEHVQFAELAPSLRMSWLLDKDVAYVYRGLATHANPLKLARADEHAAAYTAGETVTLQCTDFGNGQWKSVSVYDGAQLLGQVTPDKPTLTLPRQTPGAHAGVLVAERADGDLRTSLPVLWSVWP